MNKRLIYITTFIFLLFLSPIVNARPTDARKDSGLHISLNAGISIPQGNFKSTTFLGRGGYALNGYGGSIEIEHPINRGWIGPAFEVGYYVNPFNLSAYKNAMSPYINEYPFIHYTLLGASPYKVTSILLGEFVEETYKKFTVEFKGMLGAVIYTLPYVNNTQTIGGSSFPIVVYPEAMDFILYHQNGAFIAYYFELSLRYALARHVTIRANAGYFSDFKNTADYYPTPLSQLHLELGLAYHLT